MRLPITDEFLWDLYNLLEKTSELSDDVFLFQPKSLRQSVKLEKLKRSYERKRGRTKFSRFIYHLKKKGYIKIKNLEGKKGALLTKKGLEKVLKVNYKIKSKKRRKDGKWQMVIFDIPERKRRLRDLLRERLQLLGYEMLQKSIWVCPYDVYRETEETIQRNSLDSYVKVFLIEEIST